MDDRDRVVDRVLAGGPWADWRRVPLAGDASNRRYLRLIGPGGETAVAMDAPASRGEDVGPFLTVARYLIAQGLGAPHILAADPAQGVLVLEDLGDALFARVIAARPDAESRLYRAAAEVLATLHRAPPPDGIARYAPAEMARLAALAYEWYGRGALGAVPAGRAAFLAEIETLLDRHAGDAPVLCLRDYHAENLIWRPDRADLAQVGLLDFQDARMGHPAYDLMSLIQDARRDVTPAVAAQALARFLDLTGHAAQTFQTAYAVLNVQRQLRIVGVFARLSLHFGKPAYVDLIPRVWRHLTHALRHPTFASLGRRIEADLPPPSPAILTELKTRCATIPTL